MVSSSSLGRQLLNKPAEQLLGPVEVPFQINDRSKLDQIWQKQRQKVMGFGDFWGRDSLGELEENVREELVVGMDSLGEWKDEEVDGERVELKLVVGEGRNG